MNAKLSKNYFPQTESTIVVLNSSSLVHLGGGGGVNKHAIISCYTSTSQNYNWHSLWYNCKECPGHCPLRLRNQVYRKMLSVKTTNFTKYFKSLHRICPYVTCESIGKRVKGIQWNSLIQIKHHRTKQNHQQIHGRCSIMIYFITPRPNANVQCCSGIPGISHS